MLALFSMVFILFGAPAILLFAGRLIQSRTDALHGAVRRAPAPALSGSEWYCRPPAPLFGPAGASAGAAGEADGRWFQRPLPPLFAWSDLRRLMGRARGVTR